jgi:hypothetical protein
MFDEAIVEVTKDPVEAPEESPMLKQLFDAPKEA